MSRMVRQPSLGYDRPLISLLEEMDVRQENGHEDPEPSLLPTPQASGGSEGVL